MGLEAVEHAFDDLGVGVARELGEVERLGDLDADLGEHAGEDPGEHRFVVGNGAVEVEQHRSRGSQ